MDIIEFFNHSDLELPKSRANSNKSYIDFIRENFDKYLALVKQLSGTDYLSKEIFKNTHLISNLCESLIVILEEYYKGQLYNSYLELDNRLKSVDTFLSPLYSSDLTTNSIDKLFRLRSGDNFDHQRKDLFHLPFELRHNVKTRRYSIPGLPCLYLGGSVYICWEEMNRPDFNTISGAAFGLIDKTKMKILDFGYRSPHIAEMIFSKRYDLTAKSDVTDLIISQAIIWPLIFSCSIKTKHKDSSFHEEYIISQLLLQWIMRDDKIDGIRYFSTKIKGNYDYIGAFMNYAFPVKTYKDTGFCDNLVSRFKVSKPYSWQISQNFVSYEGNRSPNEHLEIIFENGSKLIYINSPIEKFEICLDNDYDKII